MKIVTVYPYLWDRGGAPDLALELARELNTEGKPIVLTNSPSIHECYMNLNVEYKRFSLKNIWRYCFGDEIVVLSHHRKQTSILVLLNLFLFFNKLKIVHVAHNSFDNLKWACFFPKKVIAVSNSVKDNLVRYFGVKEKSIMVIFNGMKDHYLKYLDNIKFDDEIKIVLLAALFPVKQQIEFVKRTKGKISSNIKIYFAGKGPDEKALIDEIENSNQYIVLGFIDVYKELYNYDYVCLFSKKEGLPLSLIDGCMFAKPLITNDIKSVLDINMNGYNGFVVSDWEGLIECINNLPLPGTGEYHRLSFNSRKVYENKFLFYAMIDNYKKYLSMF